MGCPMRRDPTWSEVCFWLFVLICLQFMSFIYWIKRMANGFWNSKPVDFLVTSFKTVFRIRTGPIEQSEINAWREIVDKTEKG